MHGDYMCSECDMANGHKPGCSRAAKKRAPMSETPAIYGNDKATATSASTGGLWTCNFEDVQPPRCAACRKKVVGDETAYYATVTHDGITHPSGPPYCKACWDAGKRAPVATPAITVTPCPACAAKDATIARLTGEMATVAKVAHEINDANSRADEQVAAKDAEIERLRQASAWTPITAATMPPIGTVVVAQVAFADSHPYMVLAVREADGDGWYWSREYGTPHYDVNASAWRPDMPEIDDFTPLRWCHLPQPPALTPATATPQEPT